MDLLLGVAVGILIAQLATLATTVYLHRGLTHRALTVHPAAAFVLRTFLWMSTAGASTRSQGHNCAPGAGRVAG